MTVDPGELDPAGHYVYRYRDADGVLLYVGRSGQPLVRFRQGHADKDWRNQVADIELERFDTEAQADQAETDAIQAEGPLYNVAKTGKPGRPRPRRPAASPVAPGRNCGGAWLSIPTPDPEPATVMLPGRRVGGGHWVPAPQMVSERQAMAWTALAWGMPDLARDILRADHLGR